MEFIFELILELLIEGGMSISSNKKISKWIRIPIALLLLSFFGFIIGGLIVLGILIFKENKLGGAFVLLVGVILLMASIIKFQKIYFSKKNEKKN